MSKIDCLLVAPSAAKKLYQALSNKFSAIEPNIWASLLAQSCRSKGFSVNLLDVATIGLPVRTVVKEASYINPRLYVIVATGQNPNDSSASMTGVVDFATELKKISPLSKIAVVGPHVNALPRESLNLDCIDIVFQNEGVYALHNLLRSDLKTHSLYKINGIGFKDEGHIVINEPEQIVPQEKLEEDLPGLAFDLLGDISKYRTSTWHTNFHADVVSPFMSVYTSIGCPYKCFFCLINVINSTSNSDRKKSSDSSIFRYWNPEFTIKQLERISELGIKNLKIADEMYVLNPHHFLRLSELIIEKGLDFNIWCYARINTIKEKYLEILKKSGVNWIGLGIESGNENIRQEITKGHFKDVNIRDVVKLIRDYDISVTGNFIYGLGHDNYDTMQQTYDLSVELNTENMNAYGAMFLPGSPLYLEAIDKGWEQPGTFEGWGFLSYECQPAPTDYLTPAEVLKFRDEAVLKYFRRPEYLTMMRDKFGQKSVDCINELYKIPLKRKLLGHSLY
jgi:anaerobic magnesium-protoporphyrin IX monomethyl ester cyclase